MNIKVLFNKNCFFLILIIILNLSVIFYSCDKVNKITVIVSGNLVVGANQTVVLDICTSGAGNHPVTYSFEMPDFPSSGASLMPSDATCKNGATFRWTPKMEHVGFHQVTFYAYAGNVSDSETVTIEVTSSSSAPVFLQPGAGGTFDLSVDPCVNVHIEIKDDDSLPEAIRIFEREPRIEGGQLNQSGKTAEWRWCPAIQQVEANDRYTLLLAAQDESHNPVPHDFVIVLRGKQKDNCPGSPPVIVSNSPPPPSLVASSRDYAVTATITDDIGIKEAPILYYSFDPPLNPAKPDITQFQQTMFQFAGNNVYTGYIPNPGLSPQETKTVYYLISVTDNDDPQGVLCDHRVDSGLFQFDITGGNEPPGGYCERCSSNSQCASGACVISSSPFCAVQCSECSRVGGECRDVTVIGGSVSYLCVPVNMNCSGSSTCTDDYYEDNDSRTYPASISSGVYTDLYICPRDEDFYSFTISSPSQIDVIIDGWDASVVDIDLQLLKPDGSIFRTSAGIDSSESISVCSSVTGTYIIRVYGILDDSGPYSMLLDYVSSQCCEDDIYEPNNSSSSATVVPYSNYVEGKICPYDSDWYVIYANSGQKLEITLLIEESGDLDLELYDSTGTRKLSGSYGTDFMEYIEQDISTSGNYYVRVFGFMAATSSYSLEFAFGTSSGCTTTYNCPAGKICSAGACIDDRCTPPGTCPSGHFCPTPGGSEWESDCVDSCTSSTSCRTGYACKNFPEGSGCGQAGTGRTGDSCFSFRSCSGQMTCLNWPGGYCAKLNCIYNTDCPSDSYCVDVTGFLLGVCVKDCWASDDMCRLSSGYRCECVRDIENSIRFVCLAPGATATSCF